MEKIAMTIQELCYGLGIGRTKAYELISDGELDTFKIGRRTLVTADSVDALVERRLFEGFPGDAMEPTRKAPFRLGLVPSNGSTEE